MLGAKRKKRRLKNDAVQKNIPTQSAFKATFKGTTANSSFAVTQEIP